MSRKPRPDEQTQFHNVDLDVESSADMTALIKAMEPAAFPLQHHPTANGFHVSFELNGVDVMDAESTIRELVKAVDSLPAEPRGIWDGATMRRFSIGIGAGLTPHAFHLNLTTETLVALSAIRGTLEIVVYAPAAKR